MELLACEVWARADSAPSPAAAVTAGERDFPRLTLAATKIRALLGRAEACDDIDIDTLLGIGEVVVRALDPRLRSAMVVEDGVRRVVINSRYPLDEVRKGDLWYQLETALREVCVTIPEATVPEFERKVNDLMLVSLSLTKRPQRRRGPAKKATVKGACVG